MENADGFQAHHIADVQANSIMPLVRKLDPWVNYDVGVVEASQVMTKQAAFRGSALSLDMISAFSD